MPLQSKVIIYTKLHTVMKILFSSIVQISAIIHVSEHNLLWDCFTVLFSAPACRPSTSLHRGLLSDSQTPTLWLMVVLLFRRRKQTQEQIIYVQERRLQWGEESEKNTDMQELIIIQVEPQTRPTLLETFGDLKMRVQPRCTAAQSGKKGAGSICC